MDKLIAGAAISQIAKKKFSVKQPIPVEFTYMSYGCWTTGLALIACLGHATYLKSNRSKFYHFGYKDDKQYFLKPLAIYIPIIFNQLMASFSSRVQECFLLTCSSLIYFYQSFVDVPYIQYLSLTFTLLAGVLKYQSMK